MVINLNVRDPIKWNICRKNLQTNPKINGRNGYVVWKRFEVYIINFKGDNINI